MRLDESFCAFLKNYSSDLYARLLQGRSAPDSLDKKAESHLLMELAPVAEDYISKLFGIEADVLSLAIQHHGLAPLYVVKRQYVQRQAAKAFPPDIVSQWDSASVTEQLHAFIPHIPLSGTRDSELALAREIASWMRDEQRHAAALDSALRYTVWALYHPEGRQRHEKGLLFHVPHKTDPQHLIPLQAHDQNGVPVLSLSSKQHRLREGFKLTDAGADLAEALDEAHYCIVCHPQGKDSCSHGLRDKQTEQFQKNTHGVTLHGCPLDQKISEMNALKAQGAPIGALAMVVVDNPLCAATGHRICNDCMKSCIFQKQEPVDIPQIETRTLKDVLNLPWGFEIYSLLTRWNPLNLRHPLPKLPTGKSVLVAGMGPAGFTLAHYLLNEGHAVTGIDGLKIEPLDKESLPPHRPVKNVQTLYEELDDRIVGGFGGVAEYGITVRWDKNFLKIVRLLLESRDNFTLQGGIRLGGTLTLDQAFSSGFDHIALCLGAGKPTYIPMPNGLAKGIRQASDFLMSLQLTGAAKKSSIANLQLQLPIVVIGGGLTAIDAATEALAYYPVQVEKFLSRYEILVNRHGKTSVQNAWSEEDADIAHTFIEHALALRQEKALALSEDRPPRVQHLLDQWGGATVVYRRSLQESPAYRLNHEEVAKAMEEGIKFIEHATPVAIDINTFRAAKGLRVNIRNEERTIPARTILVAAGTQPNTSLAEEESSLALDGAHFQALDETGQPVSPERLAKPEHPYVLTQVRDDGRAISFFGDLHPSFSGNVVKAMASAKRGYSVISRLLEKRGVAQ